jgi:hypothetical protein
VKHGIRAAFPVLFASIVVCAGLLIAGGVWAQTAPTGKTASGSTTTQAPKFSASAIQIEPMDPGDLKIPPDFRVAIYEYLIEQIQKTGKFQHVYRSGDKNAAGASDLVTLHTTAETFKQGSQKTREVTTVGGWTSIKLKVQIADHSGKTLVDREVTGRVRFMGENLNATYDFSKKVAAIIRESF